ncbi:MAG: ATP-binding protein, partial [Lactobacillus iners]|nr:ATP-binding protein [Lactobacillus iners]
KIVRMFNNLISNAVKYGVGAKNIYVSVKKISNDMVQIIVSNDGQAIPQDALGKLFDRFYRVEESRSPKTGGSGLGLAITKTIVEMHHGTIFCTSNQKLTSFIIDLPINIQKNNLDVL